ncbi:hypothetical protein EON65_57920 [archaeon]|nr:MAG: hypothetical protein EON65_57920 [archaeon]
MSARTLVYSYCLISPSFPFTAEIEEVGADGGLVLPQEVLQFAQDITGETKIELKAIVALQSWRLCGR